MLDPFAVYDQQVSGHPIWDLTDKQLAYQESAARHKLWAAGRRSGKSDGARELVAEMFYTYSILDQLKAAGRRRIFWFVGPEYSDPEKEFRVLWDTLVRLEVPFDRPGSYNDPLSGNMHISLFGGYFQVHCQSAKYPSHLVGEALEGVIMCEAAKMKPSIWVKYIRPMLSDYDGWSRHTSTPEGKNHFFDHYNMGQDPGHPDWFSQQSPSWYNPHVFKTPTVDADVKILLELMREERGKTPFQLAEKYSLTIDSEVLQLASDMSIEMFKQEICADFTEFVGQVFLDYDEEYHVSDLEYNPDWRTYAAVDWGFTNPSVFLLIQVGDYGEINVLDEVYEESMTADMFAEEVRRRGLNPPSLHVFYPDPADPGSSRILAERLKINIGTGTGGELKYRIDLIRKALREPRLDYTGLVLGEHANFRPKLMFDRKCVRTRADMMAYRYPEIKDETTETSRDRFELPMKKDDHGPEALGRFFAGVYGAQSLWGPPGTRITKGNLSRRPGRRAAKRREQSAESVGIEPLKPIRAMRPTMHELRKPTYKK